MSIIDPHICRVCSLQSAENESLFINETTDQLSQIGQMLSDCLSLKLAKNDGYPERLCQPCTMQLTMFHKFRSAGLRMHEKFTEKLNIPLSTATPVGTSIETKSVNDDEEKSHSETNKVSTDKTIIDEYENESIYEDFIEKESDEDEIEIDEILVKQEELNSNHSSSSSSSIRDVDYLDEEFEFVDSTAADVARKVADEDSSSSTPQSTVTSNKIASKQNYCSLCKKWFDSPSDLNAHKRDDHQFYFDCDLCEKTFANTNRLRYHRMRHSVDRPIECDRCDKRFKNKYDLKIHMNSHDKLLLHNCTKCDRRFRVISHLKAHLESHELSNRWQCPHCKMWYKTQRTLNLHIQSMHTNRNAFTCPTCLKTFGLKFRFDRHVAIHKREIK